MEVITDPVIIATAQEDGRKMIIVMSLALGALFYSTFTSFAFDVYLITSLCESGKWPNVFKTLTRLTYFCAKFLGLMYFITGLCITQKNVNCSLITRWHQVCFYILQISNHWLFASRNLATWRNHRAFPYILAYSVTGISILISLAACCIWDGKIGRIVEPLGCVYPLNRTTQPRLGFSASLLFNSIAYHSINMILAAIRFANLADINRDSRAKNLAWWKWPLRLIAVKLPRDFPGAEKDAPPPDALAHLLIKHGLHYWIFCLLASITLVALPLLLRTDNWFLGAGILMYAFIDTELGARIFRDTVTLARLARAPPSQQHASTNASTNRGGTRTVPTCTSISSPSSRPLNWTLATKTPEEGSRGHPVHQSDREGPALSPTTPMSRFSTSVEHLDSFHGTSYPGNASDANIAFDDRSDIDLDYNEYPMSPTVPIYFQRSPQS